MGIEPTLSAWKAEVLPLNYTRNCLNGGGGRIRTFEAETADLQSAPFNHSGTPPKVQARILFVNYVISQGTTLETWDRKKLAVGLEPTTC